MSYLYYLSFRLVFRLMAFLARPLVLLGFWVKARVRDALTPTYRLCSEDPTTDFLRRCQGLLGVAVVVVSSVVFKAPEYYAVDAALDRWLNGLMTTALVGAGALLLCSAFLIVVATHGTRWQTARQLLLPLGVMLGCVFALAASMTAIAFSPDLQRAVERSGRVWLYLLLTYALVAFGWALVVALWHGVPLAVGHFFRAVDGHPTLRALITLSVAAWSLTVATVSISRYGVDPDFPVWLGLGLPLGGSVVLSLIAIYELAQLRQLYGITIRWTPSPVPLNPDSHLELSA